MPRMTGGDAIVDSLLRHGVDTVFGLPGVQVYGLFDAFARNANRLNLINARHEQTTAYMAMGYAASTGKPGVFSVVPGPGVLNTTAAMATGWGINAPMLCITGQAPRARLYKEDFQAVDIESISKPVTKWSVTVREPALVPQVVALLDDPAEIVRAMAVWALSRLMGEPDFSSLRNERINSETDANVRREWERA